MYRQEHLLKNIDWFTVILVMVLVLLGWLNIYAAVYNEEHQSILSFSQNYGKQLLWIGTAVLIAFFCITLDTKFYSVFAYPIYGLALLMLFSVLVFGESSHGARSWFNLGPLKMQPSEFAKMATALALARFISSRMSSSWMTFRNLAVIAAIILFPPLLILCQPDMGSCLVYLSFLIVLYREGLPGLFIGCGLLAGALFVLSFIMPHTLLILLIAGIGLIASMFVLKTLQQRVIGFSVLTFLLILAASVNESLELGYETASVLRVGALAACAVFAVMCWHLSLKKPLSVIAMVAGALLFISSVDFLFDHLDTHQQERIEIMLGLKEDPYGVGYNVHQSLIAIGSGGVTGKGFLKGTQTKYDFVPEQSTDFIFCTIGEEWGFFGTSTVIILLSALMLRLLFLAERQRSAFSRVYGYCVVSILFFHVVINIGMTIGLLPVIGIPLPFFSYGGSSLWAFTALIFVMIRLDASRREYFS